MTKPLNGKAALVTGSTSGIGASVADRLAANGANIMLNGFGEVSIIDAEMKRLSDQYGVKVGYSAADLSNADGVQSLIDATHTELGSLDILVNNAGIQHTSPVEEFPAEKWELIISLMLSAPFYAIQAALPYMKKNGWGRIVNIASVHGLVGSINKSAYVAAKHGVVGLTKVVALETAETPVTCNAICPGFVLTPLVQKQIDAIAERDGISNDDARVKLLSEKQPSKNFTKPEQIGDLTNFLCSDAASEMRGGSYTLDGGWTAQ
jgi:3-hydroxybutyrate dehydrogenase